MSNKVASTAIVALLIVSNVFWLASFSARNKSLPDAPIGLEVVKRDVVIRELTQLLQHQYADYSKQQLQEELSNEFPPEMTEFDAEHVYFGKTVKFRFDQEKLLVVYW